MTASKIFPRGCRIKLDGEDSCLVYLCAPVVGRTSFVDQRVSLFIKPVEETAPNEGHKSELVVG